MSRGTRERSSPARESVQDKGSPFLLKTYELVENRETDAVVSWGAEGTSFIVWKSDDFARDLLPKYFKHNKFPSFMRQLNTYGFKKVNSELWEFSHKDYLFRRGHKELLSQIKAKKPSSADARGGRHSLTNAASTAAIELGKFGGLTDDVNALKRDKRVLMMELVRLRQHQEASDKELRQLRGSWEATERRQQQMMAFLANVVQNPAILQQFFGMQPDGTQRATVGRKKKRVSGFREDEVEAMADDVGDMGKQMVAFQPKGEDFSRQFAQLLQREGNPHIFGDAEDPSVEDRQNQMVQYRSGDIFVPRSNQAWTNGCGVTNDVEAAFGGLNLYPNSRNGLPPTGMPSNDQVSGMPAIPVSNASMADGSAAASGQPNGWAPGAQPWVSTPVASLPPGTSSGAATLPNGGPTLKTEPTTPSSDGTGSPAAFDMDAADLLLPDDPQDPFWRDFLSLSEGQDADQATMMTEGVQEPTLESQG